jgi:uroporphyrinogen-III decarboxylase
MERERLLYDRLGDVGLGSPDPKPDPSFMCLNGMIPALFGAELRFSDEKFPQIVSPHLSEDESWALSVPDLESVYPTRELLQQADYLVHRYGKPPNMWTTQGPLNNAIEVRGSEMFSDLVLHSGLAHHLLDVMCDTQIAALGLYLERYEMPDYFPVVANCTVDMVSPQMYDEELSRYDRRVQQTFGQTEFGIHHCGNADRYLKTYAQHPLTYLHIGFRSSVKRARRLFPTAYMGRLLDPVWLLTAEPKDVYDRARCLMEEGRPLHRFFLDAADIEYGTPDDNLRALFAAANGEPW